MFHWCGFVQIIGETLFHSSTICTCSEIQSFSYLLYAIHFPFLFSEVCLIHTQRPRFPKPCHPNLYPCLSTGPPNHLHSSHSNVLRLELMLTRRIGSLVRGGAFLLNSLEHDLYCDGGKREEWGSKMKENHLQSK